MHAHVGEEERADSGDSDAPDSEDGHPLDGELGRDSHHVDLCMPEGGCEASLSAVSLSRYTSVSASTAMGQILGRWRSDVRFRRRWLAVRVSLDESLCPDEL